MYKISWPNRITLARILLVGPFVVMLLHLQDPAWGDRARWLALGIFAAMAVSDALDGYLARRLHQESAVGRFLDPLADKMLILCSVGLLAHRGTHVSGMLLPDVVAVTVIGKDLIVVIGFCIVYFSTSRIYIEPRRVGKLCTFAQLSMVISILLSPDLPESLSWIPVVLWWTASILAAATVIQYFQMARRFLAAHEANGAKGRANEARSDQ
ncbi:MAG: CDP-alcohol phosphatidyltransferase family protein [Phycisphaerae bacterium]|nr:CDP-alcohol phosphatidyltransferase family protein [Phycisphaerae bacterium]